MKIYTAGPISGQSYDEVVTRYKRQVSELESFGYEVLCPMTGKQELRTELEFKAYGYDNCPVATNRAIKGRDHWMVKTSDIIFVDFSQSGDRVSIGSCMEIAWADEMDKHVVAILPKDNIHNHAFVIECCDIIFETEEEGLIYLKKLKAGI